MSKFNLNDTNFIYETLVDVEQIKEKIIETCLELQKNPEALPPSLVPTKILFAIVGCYSAMYEKLTQEEILRTGYPKSKDTKLH